MANPEDLVSQVSVEGTEAATAELDAYAAAGEAAFDKIAAAAKASGVTVQGTAAQNDAFKKSLADMGRQAKSTATDLDKVKAASKFAPDLAQIELGAKNFVTAIRSGVPAIASFVTRLVGLGTASVAAGVGILKLASNVAKAAGTQETALDKQTQAQINANDAGLAAQQGQIQLESSQRKLFQQFQSGQITFTEYSNSLKQLNVDYKEQVRTAAQLASAQESVKAANERLTKQAADQKAFNALIDTWGGPMLTALRALGSQADQVFQQFKNAFGPAAASGLDVITNALSSNGAAISKFFGDASAKLSTFISANGPAIQTAFTNIGTAIKTVFDGILNALPGLLAFFNDSLVPAIKGFGAVLDTAAAGINALFGTKLTGGALVFIVIIGQMTGAFVALINVIRILGAVSSIIAGLPFGVVFLAIGAAIAALLFFFPQLRQVALDVLNSILTTLQGVAAGATASITAIINGFRSFVAFVNAIPGQIGALFTGLWGLIVAGVNATISAIISGWQSFIDFVSALPGQIAQFFVDMGNSVIATVTGWVNTVIGVFQRLLDGAKAKLQPIIDLLTAIGAISGGGDNGKTGQVVTAATGGHIRGPGTATSDSIPAWLSDNEFVMKAKAVRKYGVGLMHAINSGRFQMPKFNMGGLVSALMPSLGPRVGYADGGEVSSGAMRPVNLNLFGEQFNGLMAPDDVAGRLTKFAISRQTRSAGRKPAWVGGTR